MAELLARRRPAGRALRIIGTRQDIDAYLWLFPMADKDALGEIERGAGAPQRRGERTRIGVPARGGHVDLGGAGRQGDGQQRGEEPHRTPLDRPGLGVTFDEKQLPLLAEITEAAQPTPIYRRPDGSMTNW